MEFMDVFFNPFFEFEFSDYQSTDNSYEKSCAYINDGYFPAEEPPEKHHSHLVHHGRGDQERECHAERYACLYKPDEEGNCRTRAKGRYHAEECCKDVTYKFFFM